MTKQKPTCQVSAFLDSNPDFLENYVLNNVDLETLERWTIRKAKNGKESNSGKSSRMPSLSKWKFCVHADKRAMLQEMTSHIRQSQAGSKELIVYELAICIGGAIDADVFNLYMVNQEHLVKYVKKSHDESVNDECEINQEPEDIGPGTTLAAYVASTRANLRAPIPTTNSNYPEGIKNTQGEYQVLLTPIVSSDLGEVLAVLEFLREGHDAPFHEEDEEIVNSYLVWGEIALHYADLYVAVERQKNLSGFLLNIVRSIFMEMISMDSLITKIMNFAQKLVDADRASLFLVDSKTNQLYARIFDVNGDSDKEGNEKDVSKEIRFPVGTGIAGYVAETGETLNVQDAYTDVRFNRSIDEQTGYTTKTILCMPIFIRGIVIGVVQMVNKLNGAFTKEDEENFEIFAVYCGLALHHAKLYDKIRRSEQKYKVALEVLSYHNGSSAQEVDEVMQVELPKEDPEISKFTFYALSMEDMDKVHKALFMFVDLFGLDRFEYETLVRFIITVKKNYRQVAYHNWAHGFHVANSIYSILKSAPNVFKPLECLAMFVGAVCHDLDHRGFNNKFMIDIGSPLAAIYSTSTMEHHHFNMTVTILQQENHNIFAKLNPDEYRQVLGNVKHCILATDLALFFPNKARLSNILKDSAFSWSLPDHRLLVEALMMTGSDLCASSKPWDLQKQTVDVIYEEFYRQGDFELKAGRVPVPIMNRQFDDQQAFHQGDVEKDLGWKPIPLFDRDHVEDIASMQVGFIGGICLPCYDLLVQVLPTTSPMKEQCEMNLSIWKNKAEERKRELEQPTQKEEDPSIASEADQDPDLDEERAEESAEEPPEDEGGADEEAES